LNNFFSKDPIRHLKKHKKKALFGFLSQITPKIKQIGAGGGT